MVSCDVGFFASSSTQQITKKSMHAYTPSWRTVLTVVQGLAGDDKKHGNTLVSPVQHH